MQEDILHNWILAQLKVQAGHQMAQPCHGLGTAGSVRGYATTQQGLQMQSWVELLNSPAVSFQLLLDLWRRTAGSLLCAGRALQHTHSEFSTTSQCSCYFLPGAHSQGKRPRQPPSAGQPSWDGQFHINEILSHPPALWHEMAPKWSTELSNRKTSFQTVFQGTAPAYSIDGSLVCRHPSVPSAPERAAASPGQDWPSATPPKRCCLHLNHKIVSELHCCDCWQQSCCFASGESWDLHLCF